MLEEFTRQILSGEQEQIKTEDVLFLLDAGRRTGSESIFAKTMEIFARSSMGKAESAARTAGFVHSHPITGPMRKNMRFFRPKRS